MAERPRQLGDFMGLGHFEAKFMFRANIYGPLDKGNDYTATVSLDVSTHTNFVADFIRLK